MAQTMVGVAAANRQHNEPLAVQSAAVASARRERIKAMLQQIRSGKPKSLATVASKTTGAILQQLVGAKLGFVVGAMMIAGGTLWAQQNNLLNVESLGKIKATAIARHRNHDFRVALFVVCNSCCSTHVVWSGLGRPKHCDSVCLGQRIRCVAGIGAWSTFQSSFGNLITRIARLHSMIDRTRLQSLPTCFGSH